MNNKIRAAFLVLIVLQALHSVEEFIFKFYEVFPPMVSVYRDAPAMARPAFTLANSILVAVGFVCLFRWVWPARPGARAVAWVWAGAEAFNVIAHCVWAILIRGYNPGLVTGLGFVPVVAYLIYLLRRAKAHAVA
jgi:hypothetical protein